MELVVVIMVAIISDNASNAGGDYGNCEMERYSYSSSFFPP